MERTKKIQPEIIENDPDPIISWKKTGGGSFHFKNRIIKPGQTFQARLSELSESIRRFVLPLSEIKAIPTEKIVAKKLEYFIQPAYTITPRGNSKSWFDAVDKNGTIINEKALTKVASKELEETYFNIVNSSGKVINEKALEKESADKLLQDLLK